MVKESDIREVQDQVRDLIDWIEVYREEYDLADDACEALEDKLRDLSKAIAALLDEEED